MYGPTLLRILFVAVGRKVCAPLLYTLRVKRSAVYVLTDDQWRRSQVKSGGIKIEKSEGVESGEGLCPPQLGVWGLKKQPCAEKLCNFEQVLVLLSYITT